MLTTERVFSATSAPAPRAGVPDPAADFPVGGRMHQILLALRAGAHTREQLNERFPGGATSLSISKLRALGLVTAAPSGVPELPIAITDKGRALVATGGPLCRVKTLNTYCQL